MQRKQHSPWLTIPEAAAVMRIGKNKLYTLIQEGTVPHRKLGRSIHIHREIAETWTPNAQHSAQDKIRAARQPEAHGCILPPHRPHADDLERRRCTLWMGANPVLRRQIAGGRVMLLPGYGGCLVLREGVQW